ncbi:hypothetical protein L2U69_12765 [Zavarzinia compransoris]|uniref:hypothetical protein n=1 Tax=Zavarzinia marina TaxID=2911065 RepID=UPI001F437CD0|nr:hypothetical protein [Zavarzinia marina]MCF4166518.1 hypothetical protein [Zavarzinia marina]
MSAKIPLVTFGAGLLLGLVLHALSGEMIVGPGIADCETTLLAEIPSPDRHHKVAATTRGCGATAPNTTRLAVMPAGRDTDATGVEPFYIQYDEAVLRVSWAAEDRIIVREAGARVIRRATIWNGTTIEYRSADEGRASSGD